MKLFHKIFLCFVILFGIAMQAAGYLLTDFAYGNAMEQEKKLAFQDFQYNRYILQSILYSEPEFLLGEQSEFSDIASSFAVPVALYGTEGNCIFSNMTQQLENLVFDQEEDDRINFQIVSKEGGSYIYVYDYVRQGEASVNLITETDISSVIETQRSMVRYFQRIYLIIMCLGFPLIFLLTGILTRSINKVGKAAKRIAEGRYSERIPVGGKDEVGELAAGFNRMAEKVEEKIGELSDIARQKEDFAANFAHEIKTPLTSVIGYADMLYQKELPGKQVKEAANYILSEGMRLESLSLKLMDLFVLDKHDFILETMTAGEIFDNLKPGLEPVCKKQGALLCLDLEEGELQVDYDLFKTMMLNLVDNAVKADCREVRITGRQDNREYRIFVEDDGKGIPPEELGRITEAFYMVDKSRSRKQHGAGLGMALVSKIAEIHRAALDIDSDGKSGTTICLTFQSLKQ